jgi:Pentapeptide repeats (8 copies)
MKRVLAVTWLLCLAAAGAWLIVLRWPWLSDHGEAVLEVAVAVGLLGAVFPLSAWLAPKGRSGERPASSDKEHDVGDIPKLQNEIRTTIFQAIAGLAVFVGVFVAWQQLQAGRASSQASNTLASQEQVAQAYGQAVSELGSSQEDVRIGGMYALEEIFKAGQNPDRVPTSPIIIRIRPAVFGLLTAYIRTHSPWPSQPAACDTSARSLPTMSSRAPDIQEALNVLGGRGYGALGEPGLFLEHADLRNADLYGSFDDTDFSYSELAGSHFVSTSLNGSDFADSDLCGANLSTVVNYRDDDFRGAIADKQTKFPKNFNPTAYGIVIRR